MRGAHRLAWQEIVGPIPAGMELDHKCRNKACVKPHSAHVRMATHKQNQENQGPARSNTGHRGVSWCKRDLRFQVKIQHHGKQMHVGNFKKLEDAITAAEEARNELFTRHK